MSTHLVPSLQLCLSASEGGLEISTVQFAEMFLGAGHPSWVACLEKTFISRRTEAKNIPLIGLTPSFLNQLKILSQFIKEHKVEVIFVHRLKDLKLTKILKLKFPHLRIYGMAHIYVDRNKKDFFHRWLYSQLSGLISLTSVQSQALQKTLPVASDKHLVIPHGIDLQKFRPLPKTHPEVQQKRQELGADQNDMLIGVVGRFDPQKGQKEFVIAAQNILKTWPRTKFVLVGEDTFGEPGTKKWCQDFIEQNKLQESIKILSFIDGIHAFYPALDIFVMPSYKETFGLVLIEAMASGCICISTSAGGPVEMLDGGDLGVLVEPRSAEALFTGLEKILVQKEIYDEKAKRALQKAHKVYDVEVTRQLYLQLLLSETNSI